MHVMFGQEDERKKEEKDERKRKYNVRWNDEVSLLSFNCCKAITCEVLDLVNFFSIMSFTSCNAFCRLLLRRWRHIG